MQVESDEECSHQIKTKTFTIHQAVMESGYTPIEIPRRITMLSENCNCREPKAHPMLSEIKVKTNSPRCNDVKIVRNAKRSKKERGEVHL